jgi:glycosyltransferase involved in cell wall biosynthesis
MWVRVLITKPAGFDSQTVAFPFVLNISTFLARAGVEVVTTPGSGEDVALCIQWEPELSVVEDLSRRGVPIVHRLDGRARSLVKLYDKDEENRRINALASWTVFQSRHVLEHTTQAQETIFGIEPPICLDPARGSVIYNGVDSDVFRADGEREALPGEFVVLHIAFTHGIRKGVKDLVEAATLLRGNPRIRFVTVGRQDQDQAWGRMLMSLPNVTHLGVIVDRERMARVMRGAHVLFFPSRGDYCPNTVLEALACGLPAWYHPSGGTPELVEAGEIVAGVPMSRDNPVYPLHVLMTFRDEFARRAVEVVRRRFTLEHMGRAYLDLFERLCAHKRERPAAPGCAAGRAR